MMMARGTPAAGNTFLTNLVAYYKGDEASGNMLDSTANARTLTQNGTLNSSAGIITNSRSTPDATNANFATRATEAAFNPGSSPFTITLWAYTGNLAQASAPSLVDKTNNLSTNGQYSIWFDDTSNGARFSVSSNGTAFTTVNAGTAFSASTWQFIACVWDGTDIKISINAGSFVTAAFAGPVFAGTANFTLFKRTSAGGAWNGRICECGFWNGTALPLSGTTSITTLYNGGAGYAFSNFT